jgi:membrane protease YdiL (CAAX protease family)
MNNKAIILYIFDVLAVVLSIAFASLMLLQLVSFLVIIPLGAIWIWKSEGRSVWDLGYRFSSGWLGFLAIGLVIGLGIPILFELIQVLGGWTTVTPLGEPLQDLVTYLPMVLIRMIIVVAIEELVFRGFFPNALSQRTGVWIAIVLSSLLWGASHLGSMVNEGLTPGLMIIGIASFLGWGITLSLCYLIAEKSLWLPYGLHLGVNLSSSLVGWFFIAQPNAPQWWIGHPAWAPESGLIGTIVWLILASIIYLLTGADKLKRLD